MVDEVPLLNTMNMDLDLDLWGTWNWQDEDYLLPKDPPFGDISQPLWENATQEDDISYIFEESTPIKACGGVPHHFSQQGDSNKTTQEYGETETFSQPQLKRRRMLQFDNEDVNATLQFDDSFLKSKERIDSLGDISADLAEWDMDISTLEEDLSFSGLECLGQSEGWIIDCLNDSDVPVSSDDMISSGSSRVQNDVADRGRHELRNNQLHVGLPPVQQQTVRTSRNIIFKGRKSYMKTPTKVGSSVAYPFTFIKPSGVNGDVTLKDINRRIQAPPPRKAKEELNLGTSAITGKPVVNRTRIRTDGGRGCITIMRTKG